MHSHSPAPYFWMIAGSIAFTFMAAFAHELGPLCEWQVVAFFRSFIVFAIVVVYGYIRGVTFVFFRPRVLWVRSLAGSLSLVCTFYALTRIPVSNVLTITNTYPIWIALLSWPLLGRLPSLRVWTAILSGVVGVYLIKQPEGATANLAMLAAFVASVATATAMLGLNRLKMLANQAVVAHFSFVAAVFCVVAYLVFDHVPGSASWNDPVLWALLLGTGVSAAVGQTFLTYAFTFGDPARVAVVGLTQVFFGVMADTVIGRHAIQPLDIVGMLCITLPTAWVMLEKKAAPAKLIVVNSGHETVESEPENR